MTFGVRERDIEIAIFQAAPNTPDNVSPLVHASRGAVGDMGNRIPAGTESQKGAKGDESGDMMLGDRACQKLLARYSRSLGWLPGSTIVGGVGFAQGGQLFLIFSLLAV